VCAHAEGKARSAHADGAVTLGSTPRSTSTLASTGSLQIEPPPARCWSSSAVARTSSSPACCSETASPRRARGHQRDVPKLSEPEIDAYLAAGEWVGRAGGYAIQGLGARLVAGVEGDYLNVVGLPAAALIDALAARVPNLLQMATG
jgi:hypothetical protein